MTSSTARTADPADAARGAGDGPLLGVAKSLTGKRWILTPTDDRAALMLAQRLGLPDAVARILNARGVAAEDVGDFLVPTLKGLLDGRMSALRDYLMVLGETEDGRDFRYLAYGAALVAATVMLCREIASNAGGGSRR